MKEEHRDDSDARDGKGGGQDKANGGNDGGRHCGVLWCCCCLELFKKREQWTVGEQL